MTTIERTPLTPFELLQEDLKKDPFVEDLDKLDEGPIVRKDTEQVAPELQDEEEEEEIQVPEKEELEYDVKISGNPIAIIAKDWKSKGYLPEGYEVPEDLSEESLEEVYRTHKEAQIEQEVRSKVLQEMQEQGYDPEILETAKLLKSGVPKEAITQADAYRIMGEVQLDPEDENYEDYARQILTQFYADKGFAQDKIDRYVFRDLDDPEVEAVVEDAQDYFRERAGAMYQQFKQAEKQAEAKQKAQAEAQVRKMNDYLERGEIAGTKYSQDQIAQVKKALFEKTEVVVDAQGNRYRVTPYEKKRWEYQNDFEKNLKSVVDFILGYDAKSVEEIGRTKGKSDTLRELNKSVQVTIKGVREINSDTIQRRELP
jgi:hypothetical protein